MSEPIFDREARRLLLSMGLHMEMWILSEARARAEARAAPEDSQVCIATDDIREAARAVLGDLAGELEKPLHGASSSLRPIARAG